MTQVHNSVGYGLSGHVNSYRNSTLSGNWAEERLAADLPQTRPKFEGQSTSHSDFGTKGKDEAARQYQHVDLTRSADRNKDMFVQQADATGKPVPCYATLNQLAYGHCDPTHKEAHVQQFMWTGAKANDLGVPLNASGDGQLRQRKAEEWSKPVDPWSTTKALDGQQITDALAAQGSVKRESCRPKAENGQSAGVGRKARGEFVSRLNEDWVPMGLRNLHNV
ncbi:hypothetical protein WJX73_004030 [Symbiochloris irregularis]|uniref:Flagellar associated protein n=1 Tax=Symbiochloris irregularis TaxID=706552 RepID=A0AAW1NV88_9CHLO